MRKIGQGDKSEVFLLPDGRILKLAFARHAGLAGPEAEILRQLERAGVDAPRVEETVEVDGRPGIVLGNLGEGESLSEVVRRRPWQILPAARELAEIHAATHARRAPELPSQHERMEEQILASRGVSEGARAAALAALHSLPDGDAVCHSDVHMLNVIVDSRGPMLIDWVLATRGNPLGDVATALLQLRFGELPEGLGGQAAVEAGRALFCRAYLHRYRRLRPYAEEELGRWQLPVAVALAGRREGRMRRQLLRRVDRLVGRGER